MISLREEKMATATLVKPKQLDASQEKKISIKLTSGWFTDGPCLSDMKLSITDLSIPGFPTAGDAIMGFHAEFAVMGGGYLFAAEKKLKKDCKIATIEVEFSSETQRSYADLLKTDPEFWKTAKGFHLTKAKKVLKKRVADLVSDYYLDSGIAPEIVRDAQIEGFESLINLDPTALTSLFNSPDFPELEMIIAPIYPVGPQGQSFQGRAPNIAIFKREIIKSVFIEDVFDHTVEI